MMLNSTQLIADALGDHLAATYADAFSWRDPQFGQILRAIAKLVMEHIGNSDALYHDREHTMMVTLVGQSILRGRLVVEDVTPEDWLHYTAALLLHDIACATPATSTPSGWRARSS